MPRLFFHSLSAGAGNDPSEGSRLVCAIVACLFGVVAGNARLFAQSTTEGAIGGLVVDQSKAIVPGATISARNVATNSVSEGTSDTAGRFQIIHLAPGDIQR